MPTMTASCSRAALISLTVAEIFGESLLLLQRLSDRNFGDSLLNSARLAADGGPQDRGRYLPLFLVTRNDPPGPRLLSSENTVAQFLEEAGRQHPAVVSAGFSRN